jgi:hypothetical protein
LAKGGYAVIETFPLLKQYPVFSNWHACHSYLLSAVGFVYLSVIGVYLLFYLRQQSPLTVVVNSLHWLIAWGLVFLTWFLPFISEASEAGIYKLTGFLLAILLVAYPSIFFVSWLLLNQHLGNNQSNDNSKQNKFISVFVKRPLIIYIFLWILFYTAFPQLFLDFGILFQLLEKTSPVKHYDFYASWPYIHFYFLRLNGFFYLVLLMFWMPFCFKKRHPFVFCFNVVFWLISWLLAWYVWTFSINN